jgi:ketosteroid isomerase-like protein
MQNHLTYFMICISFLISCHTNKNIGTSQNEKAIRQVLEMQVNAWNNGDIDAFMEGYVKSDELRFIGSSGITKGWQSTLERYKKSYPNRDIMGQLSFSELVVRFTGPSTAIVYGRYSLKRANDTPTGLFTLNWQKIHGRWLIISDHTC